MVRIFFALGCFSVSVWGVTVRQDRVCPHEALETCRWEIGLTSDVLPTGRKVEVLWEKSIVSRHRDKPLGRSIRCNVDRGFNAKAGGYLRVWFEGDGQACEARAPGNLCGVEFLFDDLTDPNSLRGFRVVEPPGKTLAQVEHFSTLHLQCGDFSREDYDQLLWDSKLGWKKGGLGDGTYSLNSGMKNADKTGWPTLTDDPER